MRRKLTRRKITQRFAAAASTALIAPGLTAATTKATPIQTEGPFYPVHDALDLDADLTTIDGTSGHAEGEVILVTGHVYGLDRRALNGALVDVWQANHHGKYIHPGDRNAAPLDPNFQGWAKVKTDLNGRYTFKTIKPGAYSLAAFGSDGVRCRHIHFKVSQPGFADLTTQMYFEGDPLIEKDVVMADTPVERREELIAQAQPDPSSGTPVYQFDVFLDKA
jgi:protocatechuate 3,4-dioxygenase beta subunit